MTDSLVLSSGSRVAIVGGGPAGSFFALYLIRYAAQAGIKVDVTIYQERRFSEAGPKGCKGCAGILSLGLVKNLRELGLSIPQEIVQSEINHYTVHSPYTSITISNPESDTQIVSVYRGGGPRISHGGKYASFDGWLLSQAEQSGARVVYQAATNVSLGARTGLDAGGQHAEYDLIVLASGTRSVSISGLRYVPPRTTIMAQDELYLGLAEVQTRLGKTAHAFIIPHTDLVFGSLVPKGPFVNVSLLNSGKRTLSVAEFLKTGVVGALLPGNYSQSCGCRPRAAVRAARNYFADCFVAIGEAAVSRLYKDGTGSALLTAREAARTAVFHGISSEDFRKFYQPLCSGIDKDNRWGRLLFWMNGKAKNWRLFLLAQQRLIGDEQSSAEGTQMFTKAAWGMFTGSYSYRSIARMVFSPGSIGRFWGALWFEFWKGLFQRGSVESRKLHVGSKKVLILGSGFGGTYVLRNLVPHVNRNEKIETTMISDDNYFLFTPLLHEVATGRIEPRHIAFPIRKLHWRDRFNFVRATIERIDLTGRQITTSLGTFDFDYLVLSMGSVANQSSLDYSGRNVFTLKTLLDSILIRNQIIRVFEEASTEKDVALRRQLLTFIVSGAGYTGVQMVTELRDYIFGSLLKFYKTINPAEVRIILVESEPKIIGELHTRLGAYVMDQLTRMGIEVRLKSRVTRARENFVEINSDEIVPMSTLIWVAGVVPNPLIAGLDVKKDNIGRVVVNDLMEIPGIAGVYALGDCTYFPDSHGQPIPPRAHTTVRQARVVANNILAEIRGRDKRAYRFSNSAEIVSIGASKAVFRVGRVRIYGIVARLIWLAAYSLLVTGMNNRIKIVMDWLLSLLFGRDTTYVGLQAEKVEKENKIQNMDGI